MMRQSLSLATLAAVASADATREATNPVAKVLTVLASLEAKIMKDGDQEQAAFLKYQEWCKTGAQETAYEIKTAKSDVEDLTASIAKAASDVSASSQKIEDLAGEVSEAEVNLKSQIELRQKEADEYAKAEKELLDTINTLERATNILQRKLHGSALLEAKIDTKDIDSLVHALEQVVDAAGLELHDKKKLVGLVQNDADDEFDDDALDAPDAAAYEKRGGSIVDVLEDLKEKAEGQLTGLRKQEMNAQHNFDLTKMSLEEQLSATTKELDDSKAIKNDATETKAQAEGELEVTQKDLAQSTSTLKNMGLDCQTVARDHEESARSRAEELKALAAAQEALKEKAQGAAIQTYSSFFQVASSDVDFKVVNMVRKLAEVQKSAALAQLAGRISTAIKQGNVNGEDPFVKVKALIKDMIVRMQKEASEDASHKAYCDKEFGETKKKLDDLKYDIEKYGSKIDKSKSEATRLRDDVAELQRELSEIARSQAEATALRQEEHKAYVSSKTDLEQGLEGVRVALKVLRDYYAQDGDAGSALLEQPAAPSTHSKADGAGGGVLAMLEVIESDFGKNLAAVELEEGTSANEFERAGLDARVSKVSKEQDVKYKTKAAAALQKAISETASDMESAQTELDAVLEYSEKIRGMCELKPDTFQSRAERRQAEIDGLKAALEALAADTESDLLQRSGGALRGVAPHKR